MLLSSAVDSAVKRSIHHFHRETGFIIFPRCFFAKSELSVAYCPAEQGQVEGGQVCSVRLVLMPVTTIEIPKEMR